MEHNPPKPGYTSRIRNYYDEVIAEGKRVTWPSKEDVRGGGMVLLAVLVAMSVLLGAFDWITSQVVEILFTR